ncbi:MAG: glycoside hydrolase family 3 protein [Pseudomonadota bacterium]
MTGAFILGCAGLALSPAEARFFREADPWGFILFERNASDKAQLRALTQELRESVGRDAPVFIDQEGGRVQRLWPPVWSLHPPALDLCAVSPHPARAMYLRSRLIAAELRELGIDGNCAPLGDLAREPTHPRLKNRCYGFTPADVIARARAVAEGQKAGGVLSVLKHMPGHGGATKDSHIDLPVVRADKRALSATDFAPFKALNDLALGMTGHVVFEAYDKEQPATTSPVMHRVIREEIGFQGFLMTDDLSMDALRGTVAERCAAALSAGCDAILHCNGDLQEMEDVAASGQLTRAANERAEAALAGRTKHDEIDMPALEAELQSLSRGAL